MVLMGMYIGRVYDVEPVKRHILCPTFRLWASSFRACAPGASRIFNLIPPTFGRRLAEIADARFVDEVLAFIRFNLCGGLADPALVSCVLCGTIGWFRKLPPTCVEPVTYRILPVWLHVLAL